MATGPSKHSEEIGCCKIVNYKMLYCMVLHDFTAAQVIADQ